MTLNDTPVRLTDAQRDAMVVRLAVGLAAVIASVLVALMLASVLGWVRPSCDGLPLNNRVGGCYIAPDATTAAPSPLTPLTGLRPTIVP